MSSYRRTATTRLWAAASGCAWVRVAWRRRLTFRPAGAREIIRFDGIESYGELYVNGKFIGMTKGSRLSAEFDVTDALVEGDNLFAVKVLQYSDGSYIEDQDMWWASGIFRDVYLMQRPAAHLVDFRFRTHREGDAALITLDTVAEGASRVVYTLSDGQNVVATGECVDGHAECSVADAHFWNPEDPFLYDLTLEVYDGRGDGRGQSYLP